MLDRRGQGKARLFPYIGELASSSWIRLARGLSRDAQWTLWHHSQRSAVDKSENGKHAYDRYVASVLRGEEV